MIRRFVALAVFALWICILYSAVCIGIQALTETPLPMVCGWGAALVLEETHDAEIPVGSLILVQRTGTYCPSDTILYLNDEGRRTLCRLSEDPSAGITIRFPCEESRIIGKVVHHFPDMAQYLGQAQEPATHLMLTVVTLTIGLLPIIILKRY